MELSYFSWDSGLQIKDTLLGSSNIAGAYVDFNTEDLSTAYMVKMEETDQIYLKFISCLICSSQEDLLES